VEICISEFRLCRFLTDLGIFWERNPEANFFNGEFSDDLGRSFSKSDRHFPKVLGFIRASYLAFFIDCVAQEDSTGL
jgi:hypothetical protein